MRSGEMRSPRAMRAYTAETLPEQLASALAELPGTETQRMFAPRLCYGRHFGPPPADARHAAVAVLLYRHDEQWYVPLTLRPKRMARHAGQVCLPGGAIDEGESPELAALRELQEELAVEPNELEMLGQLAPVYVFASNFYVTPYLCVARRRPLFRPDEREVSELLEVPLLSLLDASRYGRHRIQRKLLTFEAPHIVLEGHRVWGATCLILGQLIGLCRRQHPWRWG